MTYTNASHLQFRPEYPRFLNKALSNQATLYYCGLSLAELSHIIERTEHDIYRQYVSDVTVKEYRHNESSERSRIVSEIVSVWSQIQGLADSLTIDISATTADAALKRLQTEKVDGYDLFMLEAMKSHGVLQIITDDGDFVTVPDIQVFTANRNVLTTARNQNKLITR